MLTTPPLRVVQDDGPDVDFTRECFLRRRLALKGHGATTRFGGSSLGDIIHVGYSSPYKLYKECMAETPPEADAPNQAMLDGIKYERPACLAWELLTEPIERVPTRIWGNSDDDDLGEQFAVSPDGTYCDKKGNARYIVEFKVPRASSVPYVLEWDAIPVRYWAQLELYCRAYGCAQAYLVFALRNRDDETRAFFDLEPREMAAFLATPANRRRAMEHYFKSMIYTANVGFAAYLQFSVDRFRMYMRDGVPIKPGVWIPKSEACEHAMEAARARPCLFERYQSALQPQQ